MTEVIGVAAADLLPGDKIELFNDHAVSTVQTVIWIERTNEGFRANLQDIGLTTFPADRTFRVANDLDPRCLAKHAWSHSHTDASWDRSTTARREILTKEAAVERMELTYSPRDYAGEPTWIMDTYHSDETRAEWTRGPSDIAYDEREALRMIFSWLGTI